MSKKLVSLCLIVLLTALSILPQTNAAFAQSTNETKVTATQSFQVNEDAALTFKDSQQKAGLLKKGCMFQGFLNDHQEIELTDIEPKVVVSASEVQMEDSDKDAAMTAPNDDSKRIQVVKETTARDIENDEIIAVLQPGIILTAGAETEENFEVSIGGTKGYIGKENVNAVEANEEQTTAPEDSAAKEEEKSEDSIINSDVNKDAEQSQPAKVEDNSAQLKAASDNTAEPVLATQFDSTIEYFSPKADIGVYDNRSGKLTQAGILQKGQTYKRLGQMGDWHKIRFGSFTGYVYGPDTLPSSKDAASNWSDAVDSSKKFSVSEDVDVYDNSSGALVTFAKLKKGSSYPIVGVMGSWYKVNVAGRLGYVYSGSVQMDFSSSDHYFKPSVKNLGLYDNSTGKLVQVATLDSSQVYPFKGISGNWLLVQFGSKTAYVYKGDAQPSTNPGIKNLATSTSSLGAFTMIRNAEVFDNTSGKLVPYGMLSKSASIQFISKMGSWYKVNYAGRYGYVYEDNVKLPFKTTDQYFEVYEDNVYAYENTLGYLRKVSILQKGQTYKRIKDYGNWHQIDLGRGYGYVWKDSTRPSSSSKAANFITSPVTNTDIDLLAPEDVQIYDNTDGKLVPFGTILKNEYYPILGESGSWWKVALGDRLGYINKANVIVGPIFSYTKYNQSLAQMTDTQMNAHPQTDLYRNEKTYVHKDYVKLNGTTFPTTGTVTADSLNVREAASPSAWILGTVSLGQTVTVVSQQGDWLEIKYGPWRNAKREDVAKYLDPLNFNQDSADYFQFLVLSQNAGIRYEDINNRILFDKGILTGKGQAFVQASLQFNVNEIYLIAHSLLETGNGSSRLANGILVSSVDGQPVEPKMVYNMYGVGAFDSCPEACGAETAYKNGWFTPEAAIIGGAEYIANQYIHNTDYAQDTLYEMRWNPARAGSHQYATDIGWAVKQVATIKKLYDLIDRYTLYFDVPEYQ
ncbi:SH3 domain-containing protein [Falsibacillus pallidus]|uniref:SH3 domain-containing protein n=1 Tax=Falsibacillus pallidus TaxID=493781 RepID=UPI003D95C1B5